MAISLLGACASPSGELRKSVNARIAAGDLEGAQSRIQKAKLPSYGRRNMVLYYLDLGVVQHDRRLYKESDESLDQAERRMDELFTRSVSKETGRLVVNDAAADYSGERFERALMNVYRALDYLFLGDRENALVEVRKLSRLLQEHADRHGRSKTAYKDDAFAQYLSSLLYADAGMPDDARISREAAARAYKDYAAAYGTPVPPLDDPRPAEGQGELVFLHANGVAPRKVGKSLQVAWNDAVAALNASGDDEAQAGAAKNALRAGLLGKAITISYPVYVQDPYQVVSSEVEVDGVKAATVLVEDVSAIARKDLEERQALIRGRAVARAAIKFILAKAAADQMKKRYGDKSWQAMLTQATGAVAAAATETADTRAWATLPAQFRMARLALPAGEHEVVVRYFAASGPPLLTRTFKTTIRKGQRAYLHDRTAL